MKLILTMLSLFLILFECYALTSIHEAARKGDIEEIEKLLARGEDINKWDYGTPLIHASCAGKLEAVKFLVQKGADINLETKSYGNALCCALVENHIEVAEFLIYAGTDIQATYHGLERWKKFALDLGANEVVVKINKAEKTLPHLVLNVATRFWKEGKYEKVIHLANEIIKRSPNNATAYAILAHGYNAIGKFDESIKYAEMSVKIEPNSTAYMALGRAYKGKKEYNKAIDSFKKAQDIDPKGTTANFEIGVLLLQQEKFREAKGYLLKEIERIGSTSQASAPSFLALSRVAMDEGNYTEAVNISTKLIDLLKVVGVGLRIEKEKEYFIIAKVEKDSPAEKAGLNVGDRITKINGESIKGWDINKFIQAIRGEEGTTVTLTIERKELEKPKDITAIRTLIYDRTASAPFAIRAIANRELGKKEEFFKDAEKAYSLDSSDGWAKFGIALTYIDKENYESALKILLEEDNPIFKLLQVYIYARLGNYEKASEIYNQIPEDYFITNSVFKQKYITQARESLNPYKTKKLKSAKEFEARGNYKEAIKEYAEYLNFADDNQAREVRGHIAKLIATNPHLFTLSEEAKKLVINAELYTAEGKFENAVEEYKKAIKLQPFFPGLYKAIALNYAQLEDYKKAIRNMKIYLELYPDAPDVKAAKDEIYRWEFMMEKRD